MPRRIIGNVGASLESEFRADVIATCQRLGYLAQAVRRSDGVIIGDVGMPDVFIAHPRTGAVGLLELKMPGRNATPEQAAWLHACRQLSLAMVVRPGDDWRDCAEVLAELAGHKVGRR